MSDNDVAIFLDLDNLVIGAREANLNFDIELILDTIKQRTNGRVVLRRAYSGNLRQDQKLMKELAAAGFTMQSAVSLNNYAKNLVDMYLVVEAMETLVDGQAFAAYVLVTGDRDFMPLVHALRKRGKYVIGVGLRHATSEGLRSLCDEYFYYEDILPAPPLADAEIEALLVRSLDSLLSEDECVRASVLKERMIELSDGQFGRLQYTDTSFTKFLGRFPNLLTVEKDGTTTYVRRAGSPVAQPDLYRRYRSELKKQKLRVIPPRLRLLFLREMIAALQAEPEIKWHELIDRMTGSEQATAEGASRNMANAMLVLARRAGVTRTLKGRSLSNAPVLLAIDGAKPFQEGVLRCDAVYLEAIRNMSESFDLKQAALALYDQASYEAYMRHVMGWLRDHPLNGADGR